MICGYMIWYDMIWYDILLLLESWFREDEENKEWETKIKRDGESMWIEEEVLDKEREEEPIRIEQSGW